MNNSAINSSILRPNDSVGRDCSFPVAHGIALILINTVVCVSGTLGNILVCVAVATNPRLRRRSNYLLASLAIADLIVTMICEPLFVVGLFKRTFWNNCAANLERPYATLARLSCTASVTHLAAISVDRLIAVVFPLRHKFIMESHGLRAMLITSWVVPIIVPVLNRFVPDSFPKGFLGLGMFGVAYLIVFFSYSLIVISLIRHRKIRNQLSPRLSYSDATSRVEVSVATTLAIVTLVFTASWIPLTVIFKSTGKLLVKRHGAAFMWVRTLALSNSAMNFVIYGSRMKNFRTGFTAIFQKICKVLTETFSRSVTYKVN